MLMIRARASLRAPEFGTGAGPEAAAAKLPPDALVIVPVRSVVLFPGIVYPISIGRQRSVAAAQQAVREGRQIGILVQRDPQKEQPDGIDMHRVGTVASILRYVT